MTENAVVVQEEIPAPMTVEDVRAQVGRIHSIMTDVMIKDVHYGVIPGCGDKPALLKAGAEKIVLTFKLVPETVVETIDLPKEHREYRATTTISSVSGVKLGNGCGSCSTMESKYRFRNASRVCPECGKEAIIKGKEEYGGGWLCFKKKDGCGAKWPDGEESIESQVVGKIEYEYPADYYNTCLKMAKKRASVDAVLTVTAASDIFTQDIEEMKEILNPEPEKKETPGKESTKQKLEVKMVTGSQKAFIYGALNVLGIENITKFPKGDSYKAIAEYLKKEKLTSVEDLPFDVADRLGIALNEKVEEIDNVAK